MSLSLTIAQAVEDLHQATAIYTTDPVVDRLLDAIDWPGADADARLLDPSAGDGAFVRRALARLAPLPGDHAAASRVCGYEIHPGAVAEARDHVAGDLRLLGWSDVDAAQAARAMIQRRDFLTETLTETFDRVCGNPPYLRYARLPPYFKALYGKRLARHTLADLLHAFLDRCCRILPETGRIGLVTADRWLFNQTAAELRAAMGASVGLRHVSRLDPATSFYRPKHRVSGSLPRVHPVAVVLESAARAPRAITAAPIAADGTLEAPAGTTLADIAEVRLAPWLGPHGIFVVDAATLARLGAVAHVPAVDTDDCDPDTDALRSPTRFALLTRPGEEPQGALRAHLLAQLDRMPARGRRGRTWWLPPERIPERLDQPCLLVPRIARLRRPGRNAPALRVVAVPAGILPIHHNLTLVRRGVASLDALRAILSSPESATWIERHAPRLESGFFSITTGLLRRLPVPAELGRC